MSSHDLQDRRASAEEARARHLKAALYALGTTAVVLVTDRSILQENLGAAYALTGLAFVLAFAFWEVVLVLAGRLRLRQQDRTKD